MQRCIEKKMMRKWSGETFKDAGPEDLNVAAMSQGTAAAASSWV